MSDFSEMIKLKRKEKGFTQEELSEKSGISSVSIQKYESGKALPKFAMLYKLSEVLGFDYDEASKLLGKEREERKKS